MAKSFTGSANLTITGDGILANILVVPAPNVASPYQHITGALINGSVTFTPPAATLVVVLVPPTTSVITKTLKGDSGDTGVPLSKTQPSIFSVAVTPGTFVITASGSENIDVYYF